MGGKRRFVTHFRKKKFEEGKKGGRSVEKAGDGMRR